MDETREKTIRRRGVRTAAGSSEASLQHHIDLEKLTWTTRHAKLDATAFFRGHVGRAEFLVRRSSYDFEVEVKPRKVPPATITVRGEGERPGHIMFVFDCSGSMKDRGAAGRSKIDVAEEAMESVLTILDQQVRAGAHYWVGLRAYGRRLKYVKDGAEWKHISNPDIARNAEIPPFVTPDLDVEELFPLQKLEHNEMADTAYLQQLRDMLRELVPCGQTPLYYALKLSLDDFQKAKANEPKQIVVITDGVNEVTSFADDLKEPHRRNALTSKGDVLAKWKEKEQECEVPPRIHLIGLDVAIARDVKKRIEDGREELRRADREEDRKRIVERIECLEKVQELQDLAKETGGQCYDASDAGTLMTALRKALQLAEFSVSGPGTQAADAKREDLGSSWSIQEESSGPKRYVIQLHGVDRAPKAVVPIEGGEAVELEYDKVKNKLFYPLYKPLREVRASAAGVNDPKGSGTYVAQALLPQRSGNDVCFLVSVQHTDPLTFTERPKHVWAEIQAAGTPERVYRFFDVDFEPGRPVPVFRFVARDWPRDAKTADIKLWFQFDSDSIEPGWRGDVHPLRSSEVTLEAMGNASFEIRSEATETDGYRVVVLERRPVNGNVAPVRVQSHPLPDVITHKTSVGANMLEHQFDYAEQKPVAIEITARDTITTNAIEVPSLNVKVGED
jgi:Mg-chelatase subunit ChlD